MVLFCMNVAGVADVSHADSGSSITGTIDDWLSATCKPGFYHDGLSDYTMPGTLGGGYCSTRNMSSLNAVAYVSQWDSNFKMLNTLQALLMCDYASTINNKTGVITTFSINNHMWLPGLEPLKNFGFTVQPVPNSRCPA